MGERREGVWRIMAKRAGEAGFYRGERSEERDARRLGWVVLLL